MTAAVVALLRVGNARVLNQHRNRGVKFAEHPSALDDDDGLRACVAFATRATLLRLGALPGALLRVRPTSDATATTTSATTTTTMRDANDGSLVVQVWIEESYWSMTRDAKSSMPELFVFERDAARAALRTDTECAVEVIRDVLLGAWRTVTVHVETTNAALLPSAALVGAKLMEKRVLERECAGNVLLKSGERARTRIVAQRDASASANAFWALCVESTRIVVRCCASLSSLDDRSTATSALRDDDEPIGEAQRRFERVLGAMRNNQCTLRRVGLALSAPALLLLGASGAGKSTLARSVARRLDAQLFDCSLRALQMTAARGALALGAPARQLDATLAAALDAQPQFCVLLFDDIDQAMPQRDADDDDDVGDELLASFDKLMHELRTCHSAANICVVATAQTSLLSTSAATSLAALAPGLASRARRHFVEFVLLPLPTPSERRLLLRRIVAEQVGAALDVRDVDSVADACHGYLPSDLALIARAALALSARRDDDDDDDDVASSSIRLTSTALSDARRAHVPSLLGDVVVHTLTSTSDCDDDNAFVAGLEHERQVLQETLLSLSASRRRALRRLGAEPPCGILLHGVPGCGKTLLARRAAQGAARDAAKTGSRATWHFAYLDAAQLVRATVGDSERLLAAAFARARQCAPVLTLEYTCVLFVDEFEALFGDRSSAGDSGRKLISQLLLEFDAFSRRQSHSTSDENNNDDDDDDDDEDDDGGVLLIGATNLPQLIDSSLLRAGRFDRLLHVPPPEAIARIAIWRLYARRLTLSSEFKADAERDDGEFPNASCVRASLMSATSDGLTGADIANWCNRAGFNAILRAGSAAATQFVEAIDFVTTLPRPSVTRELVAKQRRFAEMQIGAVSLASSSSSSSSSSSMSMLSSLSTTPPAPTAHLFAPTISR